MCQHLLKADAKISFHPLTVPAWDEQDVLDFPGSGVAAWGWTCHLAAARPYGAPSTEVQFGVPGKWKIPRSRFLSKNKKIKNKKNLKLSVVPSEHRTGRSFHLAGWWAGLATANLWNTQLIEGLSRVPCTDPGKGILATSYRQKILLPEDSLPPPLIRLSLPHRSFPPCPFWSPHRGAVGVGALQKGIWSASEPLFNSPPHAKNWLSLLWKGR